MSHVCTGLIFTIFVTILLVNLPTSYSFRCFICSTETDQNCGDPFNNTANTAYIRKENCHPAYNPSPQNRYVCRKVKYHKPNNEIAVYRSCEAENDHEGDPCSPSQLNNYLRVEHCSTCSTDLCNSAPALFKLTSLFGPVLVFASKIIRTLL